MNMADVSGLIIALGGGGGGGGGSGNYNTLINLPKINGFTLKGDKKASQLGLQVSEEEIKKAFVATYGNINLLDNPYSDWQTYVNDMAIELAGGLKHLFVPYSPTMLVEVYIDRDGEYPIKFNWAGKLYGKNETGIKEIGVSPDSVVLKDELADEVQKILYDGVVDAGEM